jgi:hypothetical protein
VGDSSELTCNASNDPLARPDFIEKDTIDQWAPEVLLKGNHQLCSIGLLDFDQVCDLPPSPER